MLVAKNVAFFMLRKPKKNSYLAAQLFGKDLTPASRRRAQIHNALHAVKDVELVVDLHELEGAARPPAFLLGQAVVHVSFVLGGAPHFLYF
jgi:hypothetical protein